MQYPEPKPRPTIISTDDIDTVRVELKHLRPAPGIRLNEPEKVAQFLREMEDYDREHVKVIYLDTKLRVIGVEDVSVGSLNEALTHPRETVKGAVLANAATVIIAHNHPSGTAEPSKEDIANAQTMVNAFNLLNIDVTDYVIVGKEGFYSFSQHKVLPKPQVCIPIESERFKKELFGLYTDDIEHVCTLHRSAEHPDVEKALIYDIKRFYSILNEKDREDFLIYIYLNTKKHIWYCVETVIRLPIKAVAKKYGYKIEFEGGEIMDEKSTYGDECNIALEAALSTLRKYCGGGEEKELEIGGTKIILRCPQEVYKVAEDKELTLEQKIEAVKKTAWAQNLVKGWLSKMMPFLEPGTPEYEKAYETMLEKVARGMVT